MVYKSISGGNVDSNRKDKIHMWTKEEKDYLKKIVSGKSYKEITKLMNLKFEYEFRIEQIKGAINRYKLNTGLTGRFKKGNVPPNKGVKGVYKANSGSFKKGQKSINRREVGSERINRCGYTEIKIAEPDVWGLKHKFIWEKEFGKTPKGYVIIFADSNKRNLSIENLILISKRQLVVMNRNNLIKNNSELTKIGIAISNIYIKINDM